MRYTAGALYVDLAYARIVEFLAQIAKKKFPRRDF